MLKKMLLLMGILLLFCMLPLVSSQTFIGNISVQAGVSEARPWYPSSRILCKSETTGTLHLAWYNNTGTMAYSNSSTNGTTWGIPQRMRNNTDTNAKFPPTLVCENNVVAIAYEDNLSGVIQGSTGVLQVGISINNGQTFTWYQPATSNVSYAVSMDLYNGNLYVAWQDPIQGNATFPGSRIRVVNTSNNGTTWSAVSTAMTPSVNQNLQYPAIFIDNNSVVHLVAFNATSLGFMYANNSAGTWPSILKYDNISYGGVADMRASITGNGSNIYMSTPRIPLTTSTPAVTFTNSSDSGASWENSTNPVYKYNLSVSQSSVQGGLTTGKNGEPIFFYQQMNNTGFFLNDLVNISLDSSMQGMFAWNSTDIFAIGSTNDRVYKIRPDGSFTGWNFSVATEEGTPTGVCYNGSNFFVTGSGNDRIIKYDSAGVFVWNMRNITLNETAPAGIWCNSSTIYLVGSGADKIRGYYTNGTEMLTGNGTVWNYSVATQEGTSTGLTYYPATNSFYVAGSSIQGQVLKYDGYGQYLGKNISLNYTDIGPRGVFFNGTHFWVIGPTATSGSGSVFIFNATGGAPGSHLAYLWRNTTGGNTNWQREWASQLSFNNPFDPYRNATVPARYVHDGKIHYAYLKYNATSVFGGSLKFGIYYDYLDLWGPDQVTNLQNSSSNRVSWAVFNWTNPINDLYYTEVWYNLSNGTSMLYANLTQPINSTNITGLKEDVNITVTMITVDYLGQHASANSSSWLKLGGVFSDLIITPSGGVNDTDANMTPSWTSNYDNQYNYWEQNVTKRAQIIYSFNTNGSSDNETANVADHSSFEINGTVVTGSATGTRSTYWDYQGMDDSGALFLNPAAAPGVMGLIAINTTRRTNYTRAAGLTACASIRANTTSLNQGIITKWGTTSNKRSWMLYLDGAGSQTLIWTTSSSGLNDGFRTNTGMSTVTETNIWYDVCGVSYPNNDSIFVNGTLAGYNITNNEPYASDIAIIVGCWQSTDGTLNSCLNGTIDNVEVYNWSLTSEEIQERYAALVGKRARNLIHSETTEGDNWIVKAIVGSSGSYYSLINSVLITASGGACSYTSGDFTIDCSNSCVWSTTIDIGANNFFATGSGVITGLRYIINSGNGHNPGIIHLGGGCVGRW
jgi:hypothetical protein